MDNMSDQYRTYALDLWGFGDSDRKRESYSLSGYVALLEDFMDELGIREAPLVGHALGGVVALRFAAAMPERVGSVMLVNTPLDGTDVDRPLADFSGNNQDVAVRILGRRQVSAYPEVGMESSKIDATAVVNSVQAVLRQSLKDELASLEVPALMVYGENDPLIRSGAKEWVGDCGDRVRMISLEGTCHFPMLEEANKFNRLLRQFLIEGGELESIDLKDQWRRRVR
jgi:pimeloyl-ACP methyl ester carboxylesterase